MNKLLACRYLFRSVNKTYNIILVRDWNGKFTVKYEMLNKEWVMVINKIFSEKAKKVINFFGDLRSKYFWKFGD